eukprot:461005_1
MPVSRKAKILIGTATGVSLGFVSWLIWNQYKRPKISATDSLGILSEIDAHKLDDRQLLHQEPKPLPDRCSYLAQSDLANLSRSGSNHVILDVRDPNMDYSGGHIVGSVNISDKIFYESIPDLIKKYASNPILIIYCMYGYRRAVKCMEFYVKAISELITNYDEDTKTSHYLMYSLFTQNMDDSRIHLMMYDGQNKWMDESVTRKKVDIDFCDDEMIQNLKKQTLYVLKGGFFKLINDPKNTEMIEGFDRSHYEQLELRGVYDTKMYYHKHEYFARKKFMELKQHDKSMNFKLNSSRNTLLKK